MTVGLGHRNILGSPVPASNRRPTVATVLCLRDGKGPVVCTPDVIGALVVAALSTREVCAEADPLLSESSATVRPLVGAGPAVDLERPGHFQGNRPRVKWRHLVDLLGDHRGERPVGEDKGVAVHIGGVSGLARCVLVGTHGVEAPPATTTDAVGWLPPKAP